MDGVDRGFPPGNLRASDADRDRAVSELGEAFRIAGSPPTNSTSDPGRPYAPAPGKN